jgi:hypothetical protein
VTPLLNVVLCYDSQLLRMIWPHGCTLSLLLLFDFFCNNLLVVPCHYRCTCTHVLVTVLSLYLVRSLVPTCPFVICSFVLSCVTCTSVTLYPCTSLPSTRSALRLSGRHSVFPVGFQSFRSVSYSAVVLCLLSSPSSLAWLRITPWLSLPQRYKTTAFPFLFIDH